MICSVTRLQEITCGEKFTKADLKLSPSLSEMYRVGLGFRTLTITLNTIGKLFITNLGTKNNFTLAVRSKAARQKKAW